jgi:hypothetical protein
MGVGFGGESLVSAKGGLRIKWVSRAPALLPGWK